MQLSQYAQQFRGAYIYIIIDNLWSIIDSVWQNTTERLNCCNKDGSLKEVRYNYYDFQRLWRFKFSSAAFISLNLIRLESDL